MTDTPESTAPARVAALLQRVDSHLALAQELREQLQFDREQLLLYVSEIDKVLGLVPSAPTPIPDPDEAPTIPAERRTLEDEVLRVLAYSSRALRLGEIHKALPNCSYSYLAHVLMNMTRRADAQVVVRGPEGKRRYSLRPQDPR